MERKLFSVYFICYSLMTSFIFGQNYPFSTLLQDGNITTRALKEYSEYKGLLKTLVETLNGEQLLIRGSERDVQGSCLNDTTVIIEGIQWTDMNAIAFLDAESKPPSGILNGNFLWTGDYSECISASFENPYTKRKINGKYFTVLFRQKIFPKEQLPALPVGVCLPDSCDEPETKSLLKLALQKAKTDLLSVLMVYDVNKPTPFSSGAIAAISVTILLGITVAIGTIVDLLCSNHPKDETVAGDKDKIEEDKIEMADENTRLLNGNARLDISNCKKASVLIRIAKAFSIFENTKKLMNTATAHSPLSCLNGLRVISIFWVIQGHTYMVVPVSLSNSGYAKSTLTKRLTFQPIVNGTFSVDTFFFMSGLLVTFLTFKEIKSKGRLNWVYYFVHRFWRLTPTYAFLLLVFATLMPYLIYGPFRWAITEPLGPGYSVHHNCKSYWWTNLLYINNLYPDYGSFKGCMSWSWYLANDMQFYLFIAPVVIVLLNKVKVIGILVPCLLILVSVSLRGGIAAYFDMNQFAKAAAHSESPWAKNKVIYHYPFTRWSTYVVGLLTGYILHITNCRIRMNKFLSVIGWIISASCALSVIYGLYYYNHNPGTNAPAFASRLYIGIARTVWSLCLAWLVMACASGHGGWLNKILSWKVWAPLGRLTYAAYLVHLIVIIVFYGNQTATSMFSDSLLVYFFIGNLVMTFMISYIVSMLVEAPMIQLEKIVLGR